MVHATMELYIQSSRRTLVKASQMKTQMKDKKRFSLFATKPALKKEKKLFVIWQEIYDALEDDVLPKLREKQPSPYEHINQRKQMKKFLL